MVLSNRQILVLGVKPQLARKLSKYVIPKVRDHWNKKNLKGCIPTQTLESGGVSQEYNQAQFNALADLEENSIIVILDRLSQSLRVRAAGGFKGFQVHYFGVGEGTQFRRVARILIERQLELIVYDTSDVACETAKAILEQLNRELRLSVVHQVYLADIETALKHVDGSAALLGIIPRVLDVLNNVSGDRNKMQRTSVNIGKNLSYFPFLIVHPEPQGNENARFRDTVLVPLEKVKNWVERGLKRSARMEILGEAKFHEHQYKAVLIEKEPAKYR